MIFKRNIGLFLITLMFFFIFLYIHIYVYIELNNKFLYVYFLDVGQGDSIYIRTPSNNRVLIDAGHNSSVIGELGDVNGFFRRKIDLIVLTHSDLDHSGGVLSIIDRFQVSYVNALPDSGKGIVVAINTLIKNKGIESIMLKEGDRIVIDVENGIYLDVLFPDEYVRDESGNDSSVVLKLVYGDVSFLLTGDISEKVERYLIESQGSSLESDVLKIAHHGSKSSSSENFLEKVEASIFVIQVGKGNRFNHPSEEVVSRLKKFSDNILQTKDLGKIILKTDGEKIIFKN